MGREPSKRRQITQCLGLNARPTVKPDAFPPLYADIKCNNIDISRISEIWLNCHVRDSLMPPLAISFQGKIDLNAVVSVWQ